MYVQRVLGLRRSRRTAFRGYVAISHKFIKKFLFRHSNVRRLQRKNKLVGERSGRIRRHTALYEEDGVVHFPAVRHFGLCFIRSFSFVFVFW